MRWSSTSSSTGPSASAAPGAVSCGAPGKTTPPTTPAATALQRQLAVRDPDGAQTQTLPADLSAHPIVGAPDLTETQPDRTEGCHPKGGPNGPTAKRLTGETVRYPNANTPPITHGCHRTAHSASEQQDTVTSRSKPSTRTSSERTAMVIRPGG